MINSPEVSICIPVYNGAKYIRETIMSVLQQDFNDFELLIFDNASSDATLRIVESFSDQRIKIFKSSETISPSLNWNRGIQHARGRWVKLLCADDILLESSLSICLNAASENPTVIAVAGSRSVINEIGREVIGSNKITDSIRTINHMDLAAMTLRQATNPVGETLGVIWRSDIVRSSEGFSFVWKYFIDIDFWLRISKHGDFLILPNVVGSFRISRSAWTKTIGLRAITEAKEFYFGHDSFSGYSKLKRTRALTIASVKIVLRVMFINLRSK